MIYAKQAAAMVGGMIMMLSSGTMPAAMLTNLFFAMDTSLRHSNYATVESQSVLLKELGYDGYGGSGYSGIPRMMGALETNGLKLFNIYLTLSYDATNTIVPSGVNTLISQCKGKDVILWIAMSGVSREGKKFKTSDPAGDSVAVAALRTMADASGEMKIALYPHAGFWIERVEDAVRVARAVDRTNVGVTFNLCHWLKVEGDRDPRPVLRDAMPKLFFVTINGADGGDTKNMNWGRLIQTLDRGTYDVGAFLRMAREEGYTGPVGFQGYGIPGDPRDNLTRTMNAWKRLSVPKP